MITACRNKEIKLLKHKAAWHTTARCCIWSPSLDSIAISSSGNMSKSIRKRRIKSCTQTKNWIGAVTRGQMSMDKLLNTILCRTKKLISIQAQCNCKQRLPPCLYWSPRPTSRMGVHTKAQPHLSSTCTPYLRSFKVCPKCRKTKLKVELYFRHQHWKLICRSQY